ncbi:16518_t:CDS:1, partial [Racocetra persica]
ISLKKNKLESPIQGCKTTIMNQPTNQAVRDQPLVPQNANIPVNLSFDNLTAEQRY